MTSLPYLLALPVLAYETLFILYPIAQEVLSSFTRTRIGEGEPVWVGLANYQRMLTSTAFWEALLTTVVYGVLVIVGSIVAGLMVASLLNRRFRGRTVIRGLMTMPWAFPDVPTALVFTWILNPSFGVMNEFARLLPGVHENLAWLLDPRLAMGSVALITIWKVFPFYSLVILAALQSVPGELYEQARVDGARGFQSFWHVTLPGISPTLLLLVVLASIFSFRQFTIIFLLTDGGPGHATETMALLVYNTAFHFYDLSYGATLGVAGLVASIMIAFAFLALQRRQARGMA